MICLKCTLCHPTSHKAKVCSLFMKSGLCWESHWVAEPSCCNVFLYLYLKVYYVNYENIWLSFLPIIKILIKSVNLVQTAKPSYNRNCNNQVCIAVYEVRVKPYWTFLCVLGACVWIFHALFYWQYSELSCYHRCCPNNPMSKRKRCRNGSCGKCPSDLLFDVSLIHRRIGHAENAIFENVGRSDFWKCK